MTDVLGIADPVDELICSGKGCRAVAVWGLLWNNPKIHTPNAARCGCRAKTTATIWSAFWGPAISCVTQFRFLSLTV